MVRTSGCPAHSSPHNAVRADPVPQLATKWLPDVNLAWELLIRRRAVCQHDKRGYALHEKRRLSTTPSKMSKRRREEEEESSAGDESEEELLQEMLAVGSVKPSFTAAEHVNNKDGLRQALNGFRQSDLPWIERLEVVSAEPASIKNVHDDLQVELAL